MELDADGEGALPWKIADHPQRLRVLHQARVRARSMAQMGSG